jgi:site-specific DNA recombinase
MSSAILYIRVSTDEQAEKGYSLRYQEEALLNYCLNNEISILQIYKEDYSAKNFKRPTWLQLMRDLKKKDRAFPILLLFTKWDRFSRNTSDAYSMIKVLREMLVEIQAIEQPIDLSIPENKLILAIYLATPEVENDRRGLEVKKGMRKAQEEGRWMGGIPMGYKSYYTSIGEKLIIPDEPEFSIISYAFKRLAAGGISVNKLYEEVISLGLKCCRANFYRLLHNPVYAGLVKVSSNIEEHRKIVRGQHIGLVSEKIFYEAQNSFRRRAVHHSSGRGYNPRYPLKGFVCCDKCSKTLTASGSKGRSGKIYHYYHCISPCDFRVKESQVNEIFISFIRNLYPLSYYSQLFKKRFMEAFQNRNNNFITSQTKKLKKIDIFLDRQKKIKELLLDGVTDLADYLMMKNDIGDKIRVLGDLISKEQEMQQMKIQDCDSVVELFSHVDLLFFRLGDKGQPRLIAWLFRKGWKWQEGQFTDFLNKPIQLVYGLYTPGKSELDQTLIKEADARIRNLAEIILEELL